MQITYPGANLQSQTWLTWPKSIFTPHLPPVMQIRCYNPSCSIIMESTNIFCRNFKCLFYR